MSNKVTIQADIPQVINYQSCTVQVGTTTTLQPGQDATVTNTGTEYNAVFDFGIPRGKNVYEQAVEGGYTGSEEEFNAMLADDLPTVADNISDVNTVAANISDVHTVAENIADVNTTASNISDVSAVANISSDVTGVASIVPAVSTVASHDNEVMLVADNMASVMTTANSITDVQNVASDITNINTVAGISSDISTVATNSTAVNTAATNIAAIIAAPTAATNAANSAAEAQIWAEGTDGQVSPLGGEHSSKGWADISKQYAESIGAALKYKGSVSTYSALPSTGQEIGDFWNVLDTGKNYAWTGTEWDDISGIMDLSAYRTAAAQDIIDSGKQATLVSGTNIKTVNSTSLLGSGDVTIDSLPSQTGQSGKFLTTDGTDASWADVDALPSQTGQNGKFLTTDGSAASWSAIPAGVSADGTTIENASNVFTTIGVKDQNTAAANKFWTGTKAEYDAIVTKDPNTTYRTTDEDDGGGGGGYIPSGVYTEDNLVAGENISMVKSYSVEQASDFDKGYLQTIIDKNPTTSLDVVLHFKTPSSPSGSGGRITNIFMAGGATGIHFQQYQYSSEPIRMWLYGNGQTICSDVNFAGPIAANTDAWFRLTWDGTQYNTYAKTSELDNWVLQNTVNSSIPVYFGGNYTAFGSYVNGSTTGNLAEGIFYAKDSYIKVDNEYVFNGLQNNFEINGNLTVVGSSNTFINNTGAVVVETYKNGDSWYRVYSDGWCEQGGLFVGSTNVPASGDYTYLVNLLKSYKDTNYSITVGGANSGSRYVTYGLATGYESPSYTKTTSNFNVMAHNHYSGDAIYAKFYWVAYGYIS